MIGVQAERNHRATVAGDRLRRAARVRAVVVVVGEVEQVQRVQTHNPTVAGYAT
jgi:ribosomal protein L18E